MKQSKMYLSFFLMLFLAVGMTSCASKKTCKGGGWYGNRNLGYEMMPQEKKSTTTETIYIDEDCESTTR